MHSTWIEIKNKKIICLNTLRTGEADLRF